jgi:hypothetical protein
MGYTGVGGTYSSTYTPALTLPTYQAAPYGGVLAINRKTSLMQASLGLLDTGEALLSTNPGTLVELNFAPAGSFVTNTGAATINILAGQIVPTGAIIQGLPEV